MSSKAQRKKDAASKQQISNQTTSSFSLINQSDANNSADAHSRQQQQYEDQHDDSFNRQDSGSNLLGNSALSMLDNQPMHHTVVHQ